MIIIHKEKDGKYMFVINYFQLKDVKLHMINLVSNPHVVSLQKLLTCNASQVLLFPRQESATVR